MPEIRTIGINDISGWWSDIPAPLSIPNAPPVTVNIGVPIIDLPGFNPLDYRPTELVIDPVSPTPQPSPPQTPELPAAAALTLPKEKTAIDEDPRCPPLRAKEVGTVIQGGEQVISGYEIQDGKCVVLYESIPLPEQVIAAVPSLPQVTTVGITAMVGVSAGLATPIVLKAVKPAIKKFAKRIEKVLGRETGILSVSERRALQRTLRG